MINFLKYTHTLENLYSDFCSIKPPILGIFLGLTRHLDPRDPNQPHLALLTHSRELSLFASLPPPSDSLGTS